MAPIERESQANDIAKAAAAPLPQTYRVLARLTLEMEVEVESDNEEEARQTALHECRSSGDVVEYSTRCNGTRVMVDRCDDGEDEEEDREEEDEDDDSPAEG